MRYIPAAVSTCTRPRAIRVAGYLLLSLGSLLTYLIPTVLAWGGNYSTQVIVPGVGIGPARLGMTEMQARRVLEASHLAGPECRVDVFIDHAHVIALGTRFGGCLELSLPSNVGQLAAAGRIILPEVGGIGGSPVPFVRAFGDPRRIQIDSQSAILLWANGFVARVTINDPGELITYLAVVPRNSLAPPPSILVL